MLFVADQLQDLLATHNRHHDVKDDEIGTLISRDLDRLSPVFLEESVWLRAGQNGDLDIVARNEAAMARLGEVWAEALKGIPDGAEDALLNTHSGTLVVLRTRPVTVSPPQGRLTDEQFEYGVLGIAALLLAVALALLWRRRARRQIT